MAKKKDTAAAAGTPVQLPDEFTQLLTLVGDRRYAIMVFENEITTACARLDAIRKERALAAQAAQLGSATAGAANPGGQ